MVAMDMGRVKTGRILGLAATFIGTVIGAGFASGQEIWVFFARYGRCGLLGLVLAGVLFAAAGTSALSLGARMSQEHTYYQALRQICGGLAPLLDLVLLFFLIVLGGVMLAGAGAASAYLGCPSWLGVLLTAGIGLAVIAAGLPGLVVVNKAVVPLLIAATIAVVLLSPRGGTIHPPVRAAGWLASSLLYASYNTVLSLPVLVALGAAEKDPAVLKAGGWLGAAGLTAVGAGILLVLLRTSADGTVEVPMVAAAGRINRQMALVYALILWAELFTTMVADLYGAAVRLRQACGGSTILWATSAMAIGGVLSAAGFARLVRTVYPAFGLICLGILARLIRAKPRRGAL